jgi:hypothetical protein
MDQIKSRQLFHYLALELIVKSPAFFFGFGRIGVPDQCIKLRYPTMTVWILRAVQEKVPGIRAPDVKTGSEQHVKIAPAFGPQKRAALKLSNVYIDADLSKVLLDYLGHDEESST